jgi:hypothetical protein
MGSEHIFTHFDSPNTGLSSKLLHVPRSSSSAGHYIAVLRAYPENFQENARV